jgi:hypothetical protein
LSRRADTWHSTKGAVDGDLVQGALENGERLIIRLLDEQFRDPVEVHRRIRLMGTQKIDAGRVVGRVGLPLEL